MKRNLALMSFAALALSSATPARAATSPDLAALAAAVQSNIVAKITERVTASKSKVAELASTDNYALLQSTSLLDAAKKLALQKQLAEAALEDALATEEGRLAWHGAYVGQTVDLASQTATFTHADGTTYSVKFAAPNLAAENAAKAAALEKAAEEARIYAETNVFEEVEFPSDLDLDLDNP